jgi:hypothetical protein
MMHAMDKAETLTLHIGTGKTGTSTVQSFLIQNQPKLAASGLLYPQSILFPNLLTHLGLVYYALGTNTAMKNGRATFTKAEIESYNSVLIEKLRDEIIVSGCPHILMSSEHLSTALRKPKELARLIGGLSQLAHSINVVMYIRPQYELYASQYSTKIKGRDTGPPKAPDRLRDHVFDYDKKLKLWEAARGISAIKVRLFNRKYFKNGDLIDDFFDAIGVPMPMDTVRPPRELNQRLDAGALEFLRTVNKLDLDASRPTSQRRTLVRLLGQISQQDSLAMPAAILQQIDSMYRDSNANVAARYFPGRAGPLFAPFTADKADPPETLTVADAVAIGVRLLQARDQELDQAKETGRKRASHGQRGDRT